MLCGKERSRADHVASLARLASPASDCAWAFTCRSIGVAPSPSHLPPSVSRPVSSPAPLLLTSRPFPYAFVPLPLPPPPPLSTSVDLPSLFFPRSPLGLPPPPPPPLPPSRPLGLPTQPPHRSRSSLFLPSRPLGLPPDVAAPSTFAPPPPPPAPSASLPSRRLEAYPPFHPLVYGDADEAGPLEHPHEHEARGGRTEGG